MASKRVVLIIVEGPSDKTALYVPLKNVFSSEEVKVEVVLGDITSDMQSDGANILKRVYGIIKNYMSRYGFMKSDMACILHIMDLDGAYIPDDAVTELPSVPKPVYNVTQIIASDANSIRDRNDRKRRNMDRLSSRSEIGGIPYHAVYMSCNLDHALYGKLNTSDREKKRDSFNFAKLYGADTAGFIRFVCDSEFSVMGTRDDTWEYVREGLRSLERHTNLGICLRNGKDYCATTSP